MGRHARQDQCQRATWQRQDTTVHAATGGHRISQRLEPACAVMAQAQNLVARGSTARLRNASARRARQGKERGSEGRCAGQQRHGRDRNSGVPAPAGGLISAGRASRGGFGRPLFCGGSGMSALDPYAQVATMCRRGALRRCDPGGTRLWHKRGQSDLDIVFAHRRSCGAVGNAAASCRSRQQSSNL